MIKHLFHEAECNLCNYTSVSGLTYYIFANPADNNKEELKLVYVKEIDDNWWIGSGVYLPGAV